MSLVVFVNGCVTIVVGSEVLVVCLAMQHMPYGDEQLSCHSHEDLHFVLLADLRQAVGEPAEEAVLGAACSPCAFDDGLAEIDVPMRNSARLDFLVGLVVAWLQPTP